MNFSGLNVFEPFLERKWFAQGCAADGWELGSQLWWAGDSDGWRIVFVGVVLRLGLGGRTAVVARMGTKGMCLYLLGLSVKPELSLMFLWWIDIHTFYLHPF